MHPSDIVSLSLKRRVEFLNYINNLVSSCIAEIIAKSGIILTQEFSQFSLSLFHHLHFISISGFPLNFYEAYCPKKGVMNTSSRKTVLNVQWLTIPRIKVRMNFSIIVYSWSLIYWIYWVSYVVPDATCLRALWLFGLRLHSISSFLVQLCILGRFSNLHLAIDLFHFLCRYSFSLKYLIRIGTYHLVFIFTCVVLSFIFSPQVSCTC